MFERIIRLSVHNPVFVNLLFFVVVAAGIFYATRLPREQFPEISLDQVIVATTYPGATAQDVEELVTRPLEKALDEVEDVKRIRSRSSEGRSSIIITFLPGKDLQAGRAEVEKAVSTVDTLPTETEEPVIRELALVLPVVSIAIIGDPSATKLIDRTVDELRDLEGVAAVQESGVAERRIFVDVDEQRLRTLGIGAPAIADAITRARANVPAGTVRQAGFDIFVKTQEKLQSAEDVANIFIEPGSTLRIGDVAEVTNTVDELRSEFYVNGRPAVKLTVTREETADPIEIRERVLALIADLKGRLPEGFEVILADDFTTMIRDRLDTVVSNAIGGAVLVALILVVLSGPRQALLAIWGMPVSYLFAIILMGRLGISLNVVSTFGLLIATGIIVDDSIVIIENVQRHLEMGKSRLEATIIGTKEVLLPVSAAVLTTVLAFLPLTMVGGTMGRVMKILPLVVIFCLLGSLFEAFFILPGHMAEFAAEDAAGGRTARLVERMKAAYRPFVRAMIRRRYLAFFGSMAAFVGSVVIATTMPKTFGAPGKPFELETMIELAPGVDKAATKRLADGVAEVVAKHLADQTRSRTIRIGSTLDKRTAIEETGSNLGQLRWEFDALDPAMETAYPAMLRDLRRHLATNPDLSRFSIIQVEAGPPAGAAITARLRGRDIGELNQAMEEIKAYLTTVEGVTDIRDDYGAGKETFRVRLDPDRAALYGLTKAQIGQALRAAVDGIVAAEVSIDEEPVEIVVRHAGGRERARGGLADILIALPSSPGARSTASSPTAGGPGPGPSTPASARYVRLDQVATIERTREAGQIRREDGLRTVSVLADVTPGTITAIDAASRIEDFWKTIQERYGDVELSFGGESDELTEGLKDLPAAFVLAMGLIYMVLALQFSSYVQPLMIMAAVPFGITGAIFGLFFLGHDLTMMALFGIVALVGMVVNDSLVMVDRINNLRAEGVPIREAIETGALDRLRPILSTTLTTCLGLLPLAVGFGGKDMILAPMAVSIAAGLGVSTALVLLIIPALYAMIEDARGLAQRLRPHKHGPR